MARKLTEEKQNEMIEAGIREFARCGYEGANTNEIARAAGVSAGVLFKYYKDKETFFLACLQRSVDILEETLRQVENEEGDALTKAESLIRVLIRFSREHGHCIRMYQMITAERSAELAARLSAEIEGVSARAYSAYFAQAQEQGEMRRDISAGYAAFFFDNLLMMLQFTYSCSYYRQRLLTYTGIDADESSADEEMIRQLLRFIDGAMSAHNEKGIS